MVYQVLQTGFKSQIWYELKLIQNLECFYGKMVLVYINMEKILQKFFKLVVVYLVFT
jgi:hypothetical protein